MKSNFNSLPIRKIKFVFFKLLNKIKIINDKKLFFLKYKLGLAIEGVDFVVSGRD